MIKYSLICRADHRFDSWFASSAGFDDLLARGLVACAVCGMQSVEKTLMSPSVRHDRAVPPLPVPATEKPLGEPHSDRERALADLRRHVEANSEYVGMNFVTEARKMHEGTIPDRAIHGEARPAEARALIEDGVPVAPLPFLPTRRMN
jgi:hypothetical protein